MLEVVTAGNVCESVQLPAAGWLTVCLSCFSAGAAALLTPGVATALKILFSARDCTGSSPPSEDLPFGDELELERNEVIALINLLGRFSHSVETYHRLTAELQRQEGVAPSIVEKAAVV